MTYLPTLIRPGPPSRTAANPDNTSSGHSATATCR